MSGHAVEHELLRLLRDPGRATAEIPPEQIPALLALLVGLQAALLCRLLAGPPENGRPEAPAPDRLLTPEQAAPLLGVGIKWLYRHHKQLPFTRRISRKVLRFSEAGLQKWLAAKRP